MNELTEQDTCPFQFLLDAYVDTLSSRILFPTIKVGVEYQSRGTIGMLQTCGSWQQLSSIPCDCLTALHECIHHINHKCREDFLQQIENNPSNPRDILELGQHLLRKTSGIYKPLLRDCVVSYTPLNIFNLLDEVLAQCTDKDKFLCAAILPTLRRVFGERLVNFMYDDVRKKEFCPAWTGEGYV